VDPAHQAAVINLMESDRFSALLEAELSNNDVSAEVTGVGKVQVNVQQDEAVGMVSLVDGVYRVVDCPQGFLLVNDSVPGSCLPCERAHIQSAPLRDAQIHASCVSAMNVQRELYAVADRKSLWRIIFNPAMVRSG